MMRQRLLGLMLLATATAASAEWTRVKDRDDITLMQCAAQADRDLSISIPFFKNPEGSSAKMAEAEAMLTIVRKPTTTEKVALANYGYSNLLCLDMYYRNNPRLAPSAVPSDKAPLDLLREGKITFAEYAKERIKELREADRLIAEFAQYEREEQERRKLEKRTPL